MDCNCSYVMLSSWSIFATDKSILRVWGAFAFNVEFIERGVSSPFNVELIDESESEPAELTRFSVEFSLDWDENLLLRGVGTSRLLVLMFRLRLSRELTRLPSEELTLEAELLRLPEPRLKSEPAELILSPIGPMFKSITSREPVFNWKIKRNTLKLQKSSTSFRNLFKKSHFIWNQFVNLRT